MFGSSMGKFPSAAVKNEVRDKIAEDPDAVEKAEKDNENNLVTRIKEKAVNWINKK